MSGQPPSTGGPQPPQPPPPRQPHWLFLLLPAVFFFVYLLTIGQSQERARIPQIPYSEFKTLVSDGRVESIELRGNLVDGKLLSPSPVGDATNPVERFRTRVPAVADDRLLPLLDRQRVVVTVKAEESPRSLGDFLAGLLPWLLIIGIYLWFMRRMSRNLIGGIGRGGDLSKFLRPRSTVEAKSSGVKFDDVAGQDNAKREVAELVEFLREPQRYTRLGAEIPHGILLMGPPGTGKTLLARALAGEAEVPFFSISASEFIEMFVGVGASRVREIFKQAKQKSPSIIFIDELDSVGRVRGAGLGGGHDEREQTLNQILAEMDGFAGHEAVIVLAATNRPDVLDPALLRPGRFDRHITLDLPDRQARLAILKVHTRKVPLDDDVTLEEIANGTPGFSGADLKNLVNEAAMHAARAKRQRVLAVDFEKMRDRVLMGSERTLAITPEEKHRLAVHEAGHTVAAYFLPNADQLYKVTIIPRGRALGATQQLPEAERHTLPEDFLHDRLAVTLGGRVAEQLELGSVSSGADDDIRQATALARAMVTRWGMDAEVGPVDLRESEEHPFLGREIAQPRKHSEASAQAVDAAVGRLLQHAEERAKETMTGHRRQLKKLVAALEAQETLHRDDIVDLLGRPRGRARDLNAV